MGDVIRRDAAIPDIIADAQTSLIKASVKKGIWQQVAEEKLAPGLSALAVIEAKIKQAQTDGAEKLAAVPVADDTSDDLIGKVSDDVWNDLKRPATDPFYDLIFPGGISAYTTGPNEEQPARMELLASLLESGIHPKLSKEVVERSVKSLRDNITSYQKVIDEARPYRLQIELYTKMKATLARGLQLSLSSLKRRLKSEGFSEAEIHTVIPDRPRNTTPRPANPGPTTTQAPSADSQNPETPK